MSEILDKMATINKKYDSSLTRLDAIRKLFLHPLELDDISYMKKGFIYSGDIEINTIYQDNHSTITLGLFRKRDSLYPYHVHSDSVEYLIIARGKFVIKFDDGVVFKTVGECMSVPQGIRHSCMSLEDDSLVIGLCIPPEDAYKIEECKREKETK